MINRQSVAIAAGVLAVAIAAAPLHAQAPVRVPRSVLERYTGEYVQNGTAMTIRLNGDTLFREVPGQRVVMVPLSETLFRVGSVFTVEFVSDQGGGMTQFASDGVEIEIRIPRTGTRAAAPGARPVGSPSSVRVPTSVLQQYVGVYEYIPGQMSRTDLRAIVRLNGDTLFRSIAGQPEVVLTPISETQFRVGTTRIKVEFVVDEAGVTQVMGSGFQQMLARLTSR